MSKQAASGLAIAGFVILIISLIIPLYGLYIGGLGLALVAVGAFFGEKVFTILTVAVSAVKVWFLSPTFRLITSDFQNEGDRVTVLAIAVIAHAVPVIAMVAFSKRRGQLNTD